MVPKVKTIHVDFRGTLAKMIEQDKALRNIKFTSGQHVINTEVSIDDKEANKDIKIEAEPEPHSWNRHLAGFMMGTKKIAFSPI